MIFSDAFLRIFAISFMACVVATPYVSRLAIWLGAIDKPDQFRRIHKGAVPRLGGLSLAFGIIAGILVVAWAGYLQPWTIVPGWSYTLTSICIAVGIVLTTGAWDDTRGMGARLKLLGQASAVVVLYIGGVHIDFFDLLSLEVNLTWPSFVVGPAGASFVLAPLSLFVTMFWFLACMNIWNLIDGMDGLASGVGFLVSGTLALVAIHNSNLEVGIFAAALAGSLAGFWLYNWHPACIFLGDSGSLLIGLLIGVIGVRGSLKGHSTISILFPILAMGLPISDTAMAIFRRWVRNLPLTTADRRHIHHLLIGMGLDPRLAAVALYCLTGFLCGVVFLGVYFKNEFVAAVLCITGCLAFLLVLTSRRDELKTLRADFRARLIRGRQERQAAKVTWEAIQRIELCPTVESIARIVEGTTTQFGCDTLSMHCARDGKTVFIYNPKPELEAVISAPLAGPTATFRLSSGQDLLLTVSLHQLANSQVPADIAFRFLQRLSLATAERIERLLDKPVSLPVVETTKLILEPSKPKAFPYLEDQIESGRTTKISALGVSRESHVFSRLMSRFRGETG